jgi:hypothetical protein
VTNNQTSQKPYKKQSLKYNPLKAKKRFLSPEVSFTGARTVPNQKRNTAYGSKYLNRGSTATRTNFLSTFKKNYSNNVTSRKYSQATNPVSSQNSHLSKNTAQGSNAGGKKRKFKSPLR